METRTNIY